MSDKSETSIQIFPSGIMQIQIDLTIGNADIIAFGMLEKAKNTAQAWIIQRRRLMDAAVLNAAEKEKSVIDMFGRKR